LQKSCLNRQLGRKCSLACAFHYSYRVSPSNLSIATSASRQFNVHISRTSCRQATNLLFGVWHHTREDLLLFNDGLISKGRSYPCSDPTLHDAIVSRIASCRVARNRQSACRCSDWRRFSRIGSRDSRRIFNYYPATGLRRFRSGRGASGRVGSLDTI
jgi:hypothetical protein